MSVPGSRERRQRPGGYGEWIFRANGAGRRIFVERTKAGVRALVLRTWDETVGADRLRSRWDAAIGADIPMPQPVKEWRVMSNPTGQGVYHWAELSDGHSPRAFPALAYDLPAGCDMPG